MSSGLEQLETEITPEKIRAFIEKHNQRESENTLKALARTNDSYEFYKSELGKSLLGSAMKRIASISAKNIDLGITDEERMEFKILLKIIDEWSRKIQLFEKNRDKVIRSFQDG